MGIDLMPWKCPQCGVDGIDDALSKHPIDAGGCGYVRFPSGITLRSEKTGKEISVRITTTLGNASLTMLGDDEVRFMSSEQFRIIKNESMGGWAVENVSFATNPLFLNGAAIEAAGRVLKDGDRLAIKGAKCPLLVTVIM